MKIVIMPRYLDTPQRIQDLDGGPHKTLAMGLWQRIAGGDTIENTEFQSTCGEGFYDSLVHCVDEQECVFVEVEHPEMKRIQT